jgi:hypothetical protein
MNNAKDMVQSELVLRLTDAQIAAIRLRHERRKKQNVGVCGFVDLGDVSACGGDLAQACEEAARSAFLTREETD